jgi:hypothetical protein
VADSREFGNKHTDPIKCDEFLDLLSDCQLPKNGANPRN